MARKKAEAQSEEVTPKRTRKTKSETLQEVNKVVGKIVTESLSQVMGDRFGRYSKYIIQDRALPDVRDGLKPVQRRILYSMYEEGNRHDKAYRKSAKAVGNIMGNYHPHGDSSIYEAMVRMSQDWKMRNVLIDMHGNNGSIDGDGAAAMRYTESRLTELAEELLYDIYKDTIDMAPNFDDTETEPTILPASFPNLLVNGSTGISAGYATDIPPHNFTETMDAVIKLLDKPNLPTEELLKIMKGPDFPTGGIVQGADEIKKAFETGKGKIIIRSKFEIEKLRGDKQQIVITEIPYEVVKINLVKKIDEIRADKKVDGIAEVRDESDREGLRIVIELKKDAPTDIIINYLLKNTDLQVSYSYNMTCIVDRTPKVLGVIDILNAFNEFRKITVKKRLTFELNKAQKRHHIVEGLVKALSILDKVLKEIKASKNKADAKANIEKKFGFTTEQSEAIVSLQLYRLSNTDIKELEAELKTLEKDIKAKEALLSSEVKLKNFIKKEYEIVRDKYGEERRTEIQKEIEEIKVDTTQLIAEEDVVVSVSADGYIKRSSLRSVNFSGGFEACGIKEDDSLVYIGEAKTTQILLAFTNKGNYAYLPIHTLQDDKWKDTGTHINHYVNGGGGERILFATVLDNLDGDKYITIIKNNGLIKRTLLKEYEVQRTSKLYDAIKTKDGEFVSAVTLTEGTHSILVYSKLGYGLTFKEEEVNPKGVKTDGMKGIDLREGDEVEKAFIVEDKEISTIYKEHGELAEYPRGRKGNKIKLPRKTRK